MPFTSTAILARLLGKPSVYHDPNNGVEPDGRAAYSTSIIKGKEKW